MNDVEQQSMADLTVANTILQQLGGKRFTMMTGARKFTGSADALSFRLPWPRVNVVKITLTPQDTYTMEFWYVRGTSIRLVKKLEDVYCDQLQELFTSVTGLVTHL